MLVVLCEQPHAAYGAWRLVMKQSREAFSRFGDGLDVRLHQQGYISDPCGFVVIQSFFWVFPQIIVLGAVGPSINTTGDNE